jgi:hypothetical protein
VWGVVLTRVVRDREAGGCDRMGGRKEIKTGEKERAYMGKRA